MEPKITLEEMNKLLKVDGVSVKALDVIDTVPKATLIRALTYVLAKLSV